MNASRILIVDDEAANIAVLEGMLQQDGYVHIHSVLDPHQARAEVEAFLPDLVLLDLLMPGLDGFGVLETLKPVLAARGYVPVLVITADVTPETKRRALAAGARDFLAKPLDAIEVLLRVQNLLHTRRLYVELQERTDARIREQAALIDQANDAILVCDLDDTVRFANRAAEVLYGLAATQMAGLDASVILSPDDPQKIAEANRIVRECGRWSGELTAQTPDGRSIVVASRWTLLTDAGGRPRSKLLINSDITQMKKVEEKLLRAQRLENIGHLAGGIAHDLNNVLAPLSLGLHLLKAQEPRATTDLFGSLMGLVEQGTQLVSQILTFARGLGGARRPVRLDVLLADLVQLMRRTFPRSITIETSAAPDLRPVHADPTQMHQVLTNLCVNARDAMPKGGCLRISVANEAESVVIAVEDSGEGIPPDRIDHIFEAFYTTKPAGQGTGLGLSTTRDIVHNHGGSIHVESTLGEGSCFTVYLPAAETDAAPPTAVASELPTGHGELILLVEDETSLEFMARMTLISAGYRVLSAQNGAEALAIYARQKADVRVLIVDLMMPVMEGEEAIPLLQRMNPEVPIIVCSGLIDALDRVQHAAFQVAALVSKPYTAERLLATVREVLDVAQVTERRP